jgi:hypothetical protein
VNLHIFADRYDEDPAVDAVTLIDGLHCHKPLTGREFCLIQVVLSIRELEQVLTRSDVQAADLSGVLVI